MKKLVIYGAGGLGREARVLVDDINLAFPKTYDLLGYVVDSEFYQPGMTVFDYPILGDDKWLLAHSGDVHCAIAIGDKSDARERVFQMLDCGGVELETLISPSVYIHPSNRIGKGCYIGAKSTLSVDMSIGDGVFINTDCMFGHDVRIGDFTSIMPRATISGGCSIGNHVMIGGASYIVPKRKIGDRAVVAAGSVVFTNVKQGTHVLGNPAKRIKL